MRLCKVWEASQKLWCMVSLVCLEALDIVFCENANFNQAPENILYEKSIMRLTALLDLDFARIGTFADEFLSPNAGFGQFTSAREPGEIWGYATPCLQFPSEVEVDWGIAKAWDDALCKNGGKRPSTIESIAALSRLVLAFWSDAAFQALQ